MASQSKKREPRRDPATPVPEQAPGARSARRIEDPHHPAPLTTDEQVAGSSEDFAPRDTTDIAQHAPGPHGQGDEPTSALSGRHDYESQGVPEVRPARRRER